MLLVNGYPLRYDLQAVRCPRRTTFPGSHPPPYTHTRYPSRRNLSYRLATIARACSGGHLTFETTHVVHASSNQLQLQTAGRLERCVCPDCWRKNERTNDREVACLTTAVSHGPKQRARTQRNHRKSSTVASPQQYSSPPRPSTRWGC